MGWLNMLALYFEPPSFEQTGTVSIAGLKDRHVGETATLVGKGPSLLKLKEGDIGPGPVITINEAILHVQALDLPNPTYAMQKDGCAIVPDHVQRPCASCAPWGYQRFPVIDPKPGIVTIFSQHLSPWCLKDRPNRYAYEDLGYKGQPYTPSTLEAIGLARHLGATALVLAGFDSLVTGELGYALGGGGDEAAAARARETLDWLRPVTLEALQAFGAYRFLEG